MKTPNILNNDLENPRKEEISNNSYLKDYMSYALKFGKNISMLINSCEHGIYTNPKCEP